MADVVAQGVAQAPFRDERVVLHREEVGHEGVAPLGQGRGAHEVGVVRHGLVELPLFGGEARGHGAEGLAGTRRVEQQHRRARGVGAERRRRAYAPEVADGEVGIAGHPRKRARIARGLIRELAHEQLHVDVGRMKQPAHPPVAHAYLCHVVPCLHVAEADAGHLHGVEAGQAQATLVDLAGRGAVADDLAGEQPGAVGPEEAAQGRRLAGGAREEDMAPGSQLAPGLPVAAGCRCLHIFRALHGLHLGHRARHGIAGAAAVGHDAEDAAAALDGEPRQLGEDAAAAARTHRGAVVAVERQHARLFCSRGAAEHGARPLAKAAAHATGGVGHGAGKAPLVALEAQGAVGADRKARTTLRTTGLVAKGGQLLHFFINNNGSIHYLQVLRYLFTM